MTDQAYTWYLILQPGSIQDWDHMIYSFNTKFYYAEAKYTLGELDRTRQYPGKEIYVEVQKTYYKENFLFFLFLSISCLTCLSKSGCWGRELFFIRVLFTNLGMQNIPIEKGTNMIKRKSRVTLMGKEEIRQNLIFFKKLKTNKKPFCFFFVFSIF